MAEISLITVSDVNGFRKIDSKWSSQQTRFDSYVNDIQRKNLKLLLGDALYYAFMESDRASGIYYDLLNGKTYTYNNQTIKYYGIKPALCYWWLAIACREGDLFLSRQGAIQFVNNPQHNFETAKEKERIATGYTETAEAYANDIKKFLNENSELYPLWDSVGEENTSNFISFRI